MKLRHLASALVLLVTSAAYADEPREWRDGDRERGPRVIIFQDADFHGDFQVLYPGDAIDNLSGRTFEHGVSMNDRISSIRIEGEADLYVFENAGFRGRAMHVTESIRDLSNRRLPDGGGVSWNDRISSLRVAPLRGHHGREDERRIDPDVVIKRSFLDVLRREPTTVEFRHFRGLILDQRWDERMVRENLRSEEVYRLEVVDRIIREAFRELLDRDPGPAGYEHYRRYLMEKGHTEADLREDLRRSKEYREKMGRH